LCGRIVTCARRATDIAWPHTREVPTLRLRISALLDLTVVRDAGVQRRVQASDNPVRAVLADPVSILVGDRHPDGLPVRVAAHRAPNLGDLPRCPILQLQ